MIGQVIGKYRVEERIGRGGMGTVYRAIDETLHREVAVKVLNAELNDPEIARRFRAEAVTVARLSHPGIATIYELFQHDGQWLMVMEFVRGETLEKLVTRAGPLPVQRAAEFCMQALAALSHAHGLGVVHRDLKPANLMINEMGVVKVMDFGIARVSGSEHLTNAGFMMGTPAYMAPEQVMGAEVDARADLYAMGVVFYRLTTAKLPFKGDTAFAMAQSQVNDPPTPVRLARPDLPPWVEPLVARALSKSPQSRFQSAIEFHEAFARSVAGMPVAFDDGSAPTELMSTPARTPLGIPTLAGPVTSAPQPAAKPAPVPSGKARPTNTVMAVAAAVVLLVVLAVVARFWLGSQRSAPVESPPVVVASAPPPEAAAAPPVEAVPPPVVEPPPPPPPAGSQNKPGRSTVPPQPAPKPTPTPPPVDSGRATVADAGKAAGAEPPPANDPLAAFSNIKFLEVNGRRTTDRDVLVNFGGGQVAVLPRDGGAPIVTIPYGRVRRATYVVARDPKWDAALPGPPADLDVGSVFRQARHWLVVQTDDAFAILRLEDRSGPRFVATFESRAGIKADRPVVGKGK